MQCDELQATGTTPSKVLLDAALILWGQIRLLKAVDVSRDLFVHRSGGLKQNVESQQHTSKATDP